MVTKCKMCGGDIEFTQGATHATCECCGSTTTIPKTEDKIMLNLYNRANSLRRQCEFEKAAALYERILEQDDADAEAHWGVVLSRYGIEYAEEPTTMEHIPICHRLQRKSILTDADYLATVEHAPDSESRCIYEKQAEQIAKTQKAMDKKRKKLVTIGLVAIALVIACVLLVPQVLHSLSVAKIKVGSYVEFGTYPQTASGTDNTPIEWLVLDRDGNRALLISRYGLDAQPYNTTYTSVTWETCTLRTWLNGTFMKKAFTTEEQKAILTANVDNSSSQGYNGWSTNGGNNTQDQVFLLSYAEAHKYFGVMESNRNNIEGRVHPTAYVEESVYTSDDDKTADGDSTGRWWLRSPGGDQDYAAYVLFDGSLSYNFVHNVYSCVRPALWVNLESGIF